MNVNQTQPVKLAVRANKCLCLGHILIMRKVTVYQRPSPCVLAQQNHVTLLCKCVVLPTTCLLEFHGGSYLSCNTRINTIRDPCVLVHICQTDCELGGNRDVSSPNQQCSLVRPKTREGQELSTGHRRISCAVKLSRGQLAGLSAQQYISNVPQHHFVSTTQQSCPCLATAHLQVSFRLLHEEIR